MLPGIYSAFQHWAQQTVWIYSDPHFSDELMKTWSAVFVIVPLTKFKSLISTPAWVVRIL